MYSYIDKSIVTFLVLLNSFLLMGQQETHYSNFMVSGIAVNAAYNGYKEVPEVIASYRNQWISFDGAPTTIALAFSTPLTKKLGAGVYVYNDRIGISSQTIVSPGISYKIKAKPVTISFGLNTGIAANRINWGGVNVIQNQDPVYSSGTNETKINPIFGAGVVVYNDQLFVGLSSPNLLESKLSADLDESNYQRHFFLTSSYLFDLSPKDFKIKTSLYGKYTDNAPLSVNLGVAGIYKDKILIGSIWRPKSSLVLQTQYFFKSNLSCGFAFDIATNRLNSYQSGSVEVFLSYQIVKNKNVIYSPRYF